MTQEELAEAAGLSVDMISKIEVGATGARFPSIERLAKAVQVDSPELFTSNLPNGAMNQGAFGEISAKLSSLPEVDLVWLSALIDVALQHGESPSARRPLKKFTQTAVGARRKSK